MVALTKQYNVDDPAMQSSGGTVLIPDGDYQAIITESDMKPTQSGGNMLVLTCSIVNGEHQGTELIERLNIVNANPKAEEIAYQTLAKISKAMGFVQTPADSSELHNRPIMIKVKGVKQNDWTNNDGQLVEGQLKSEIKGYKAVPAVGTAQPAPAAQPVQQPVAQPQPTQAAPAVATAPTTPPWAQ